MIIQRHVLILAALLISCQVTGQQADLSSVKRMIQAKHSVDLDTVDLCDMIVFNGILYDGLAINQVLRKVDVKQLLFTALANLSTSNFAHLKCSHVVLLATESNQSNDEKKALLDSIRSNLNQHVPEVIIHDQVCKPCKQVVVDGRALDVHEAKRVVNRLKASDIRHIATYDSPDPLMYGEHAEQGLVEIFLKRGRGKKGQTRLE